MAAAGRPALRRAAAGAAARDPPALLRCALAGAHAARPPHTPGRRLIAAHVYFPDTAHEFGIVRRFPRGEGAAVSTGDVVAEVEVGPLQVVDVCTPRSGTVAKLLRKEGDRVRAQEPLVELQVTMSETVMGWWRALQGGSGRS
ncbi:unnamed protein product [Prorocentrum cordatum]|uniref:Lipoyl-binding domain-containing protein n=1 Tax=Prorocentrum cordatum TaxID=2364126 RepID=A0ABN9RHV4_9DINO|nr:unnamed protein product [Polarella glacialis]